MRDKTCRRTHSSESGQSIIIVALLMVGMIAALGLALDGGNAISTRRKSQNAADAGALAGVRLLVSLSEAGDQTAIYNAIVSLARANGVASASDVTAWFIDDQDNNICVMPYCSGVPANATGVRVNAKMQLQPYFIDIFMGKNKIPLQAVAAVQGGNPAGNMMPMVVPCDQMEHPECNYGYGTMVTIKGDQQGSGSVQWLDFGGCTLDDYLSLECTGSVAPDGSDAYWYPSNPTWCNSDPCPKPPPPGGDYGWRKTKTGQVAAVAQTLDCWLNPNDSKCSGFPYPGNRLWLVPIANHNNGDTTGNNLWYHVYAIGVFEFYGYYFDNGNCNWYQKAGGNCRTGLPPKLQECADAKIKCVEGIFHEFADVEIRPGKCLASGTNACGVSMSQ